MKAVGWQCFELAAAEAWLCCNTCIEGSDMRELGSIIGGVRSRQWSRASPSPTHCSRLWRPGTAALSASARCNSICCWSLSSPGDCRAGWQVCQAAGTAAALSVVAAVEWPLALEYSLSCKWMWHVCVYWHALECPATLMQTMLQGGQ